MTNNPFVKLSLQKLKQVVAVRQKIESLRQQLERIVGKRASATKNGAPKKKKRKLSAAARARISAMMKARWKKFRAKKAKK